MWLYINIKKRKLHTEKKENLMNFIKYLNANEKKMILSINVSKIKS